MTTPNMLTAALWYAQRFNWYVFPIHNPIFHDGVCVGCSCEKYRRSDECRENHPYLHLGADGKCCNPGKCPRVGWGSKSTVDPAQIRKWWGWGWPDVDVETGEILRNVPNIGIDCGKSGLLTLDEDSYKEAYGGDLSDFLPLCEQETVTSITQGGGEHLIYNRLEKPYGNSTRGLPAGIDIRGVGGYIVAAPSLGKSANRYRYAAGYGPHEIAPRPIPAALDAILQNCTLINNHSGGAGEPDSAAVKRNADIVTSVLGYGEIDHGDPDVYLKEGRRWVLPECPFNPIDDKHGEDASSFVIVLPDGRITAGCHHNRCRKRYEDYPGGGWQFLKYVTGFSTQTRDVFGGAL